MFSPGQQVERIEERPQVLATVVGVDESGAVHIEYEEGGAGWWPPECLRPVEQEG
jgi:hypothetical protein